MLLVDLCGSGDGAALAAVGRWGEGAQSHGKGKIQLKRCLLAACHGEEQGARVRTCVVSALPLVSTCLPTERGRWGAGCEWEQLALTCEAADKGY